MRGPAFDQANLQCIVYGFIVSVLIDRLDGYKKINEKGPESVSSTPPPPSQQQISK